jgi:hypothetical protein
MKPYTQIGVVIRDAGSAIVTVNHSRNEDCVVTGIETLPYNPEALAERVADLDESASKDSQFVIDGDSLGNALWKILGPDPVKDKQRFRLYAERGLVRQALVDSLVVAMARDGLHFKSRIPAQAVMNKALLSYKRTVREDGEVGTELVVALCLAVLPRVRPIRYTAFLA